MGRRYIFRCDCCADERTLQKNELPTDWADIALGATGFAFWSPNAIPPDKEIRRRFLLCRTCQLALGMLLQTPERWREDLAEADYVDQINRLCEDYGCVAGSNRVDWLDGRLAKLRELERITS